MDTCLWVKDTFKEYQVIVWLFSKDQERNFRP